LVGRKLDRSVLTPLIFTRTIQFRNQTPLNRAELAYGLDTVLGWLKMVPAGGNLIKPVENNP